VAGQSGVKIPGTSPHPTLQRIQDPVAIKGGPSSFSDQIRQHEKHTLSSIDLELKSRGSPSLANKIPQTMGIEGGGLDIHIHPRNFKIPILILCGLGNPRSPLWRSLLLKGISVL
jgi:hypothetical protein